MLTLRERQRQAPAERALTERLRAVRWLPFPGQRGRVCGIGVARAFSGLQILWWLQSGLYCALGWGGGSVGVAPGGRFRAETLRAIAAYVS